VSRFCEPEAAQPAVAVDGAGRPELLHSLPWMRPGWPMRLARDRTATEPRAVRCRAVAGMAGYVTLQADRALRAG
jgi:hypothetical protein